MIIKALAKLETNPFLLLSCLQANPDPKICECASRIIEAHIKNLFQDIMDALEQDAID